MMSKNRVLYIGAFVDAVTEIDALECRVRRVCSGRATRFTCALILGERRFQLGHEISDSELEQTRCDPIAMARQQVEYINQEFAELKKRA